MNGLRITPLDAVIVGGGFLLTLGFGIWSGRRKVRSAEGLFLADREATWPIVGASMFSTNISSQQFVGQAGLAYSIGLAAGAFQLVGAMCFALLAVFFVDVYLGLRLRTAPEFLERRYSPGARMYVSALNIVLIVASNIATALYAGALVLTELMGGTSALPFNLAVVALAVAAGSYTIFGGLRSVLWIDLWQSVLLVLGGAITLGVAFEAAGGWSAVAFEADERWTVIRSWDHAYGWLPMVTGALILGVNSHCTGNDYVQRALSARSVFHSKMGALFAAFLKVVALFIIAMPGVLAAQLMPGLAHPDQAYARLVTNYVPPGLAGLVLAGLLAAILGTVAAGISAAAAMASYDFVLRFAPGLTERSRVRLGRLLMAGLLVVGAVLAPGIRQFQGVFDFLVQIWSMAAPALFVCVVAGVFTRRANARGAAATLMVGTGLGGVTFWMLNVPSMAERLPSYLRSSLNCGFVITVICAAVMMLASKGGAGLRHAGAESDAVATSAMTPRENRIYRLTLGALLAVWLAVVATFSPWGVARGP